LRTVQEELAELQAAKLIDSRSHEYQAAKALYGVTMQEPEFQKPAVIPREREESALSVGERDYP
jgi:hypothetical protein